MTDTIPTTCTDVRETSPAILTLPNELLEHVAISVDLTGLLGLRLAGNARLSKCALEGLRARKTTIYIEQTKASLSCFLDVCRRPELARHVTDIRYVSALRCRAAQDLAQTAEFKRAVSTLECLEDLTEEVLTLYEREKAEQDGLMERDELGQVLIEGLKLLPNLQTITVGANPSFDFCGTTGRIEQKVDPTRSYNKLRRWLQDRSVHLYEYPESLLPRHCVRDELLYQAQFKTSSENHDNAHDTPGSVLKAIAGLGYLRSPGRLELIFDRCQLTVLGRQWQEFAQQNAAVVAEAMQKISTITLHARRRRVWTPPHWNFVPRDMTCIPLWKTLLTKASNLTHLDLGGTAGECSSLLDSIVDQVTFPKLEILSMENRMAYWYHSVWAQDVESASYTSQALTAFLLRHQHSLKHLRLREASGNGSALALRSVTDLRRLLNALRTHMKALQFAEIIEKHIVWDDIPPPAAITHYSDLKPHERDRARERNSEIGRLALELEAEVREIEVKPEMGDPGNPSDERPPLTEGPGLMFEYDFGSYVLHGRCDCTAVK